MNGVRQGMSRRRFVGGMGVGGLAVSAAAIGASAADAAGTGPAAEPTALPPGYFLENVRLESGFERDTMPWLDGPVIVGTRTELATLRIAEGRIAEILPAKAVIPPGAAVFDARGRLMLPTFRDMHIHLDKTYYGGPWKATLPRPHGRADRIRQEQVLLPQLLSVAEERTAAIVRLMHEKGTTVARSHCNVDPIIGLANLEHLHTALSKVKDRLACEIIAFPQHGLLASDSVGLMREAMKTGLVQWVGGVDPTSFDNAMEKSVDTTVQLAVDFRAGIDIHLHEGRATALPAVRRIMDHMEKEKGLRGRVTISHFYALAELSKDEAKDVFARMVALGVSLATSVPIGRGAMPLRAAREAGVEVICGTDSVIDWWDSFGSCDILEKASLIARLEYGSTEFDLGRALAFATGGVTPLDADGTRVWPKPGVEASFNLVSASCSAEAVARLPAHRTVVHKGRLVIGEIDRSV